jgi:hypothetical protein
MKVIMVGCEYSGKTSVAYEISKWMVQKLRSHRAHWHDHFVLPHVVGGGPRQEQKEEQFQSLDPDFQEKYQRYQIHYHFRPFYYRHEDHLLINWYYADAVYADLYYRFGSRGQYAERRSMARYWDGMVMSLAPETILVLLKASPAVIRRRKQENPHPKCILQDKDVELVLDRFQEEYEDSLIGRKFVVDTSETTVQETFEKFITKMSPHFTVADLTRLKAFEGTEPIPVDEISYEFRD